MKAPTSITGLPTAADFATGKPTIHIPVPGFERLFIPAPQGHLPEFAKLPSPKARCPFSGASRTWLLEHGEAGDFKLVRIRKPGATRGAVFLHVPSLLEFMRRNLLGEGSGQGGQQ